MKSVSIREVQHNLAAVLRRVEDGEEISISRHKEVVARLLPPLRISIRVAHPDYVARAKQVWGSKPRGKSLSTAILSDREERV
jgi:prevent-host-death family protein